jgi:DNA-binding LacI/PurR family transcriptional regulator
MLLNGHTLRRVESHGRQPKYVQAQQILADAIRQGQLPAGSKLPPTKTLGVLMDVSLLTAHKALEGLVHEGLVRREVGRGTFVTDDLRMVGGAANLSIGLVLDPCVNINDFYHSGVIEGLRRRATEDSDQTEFFLLDRFALRPARGGDKTGVLAIHPSVDSREAVERLAARVPVIVLGGSLPGHRVACVDSDNADGARQAVRHLVGLGHRRIIVLAGPTHLSNSRDRADGARAELYELQVRESAVFESSDSCAIDEESASELVRQLRGANPPTAILAGGFFLALACMQLVRREGLTIPRDISIIGFDDPVSAPLLDPPLTTVRQPLAAMGAAAFTRLREAILTRVPPAGATLLPTELVIRGSAAPPA